LEENIESWFKKLAIVKDPPLFYINGFKLLINFFVRKVHLIYLDPNVHHHGQLLQNYLSGILPGVNNKL